jgi:hypothetical protein
MLPIGFMGTAVLLLLATSWVQAQSGSNNNAIGRNKPAIPATSPATPQEVAPRPVVPPPPRSTVEEPTRAPAVAWDGKQLTVDAENSTLADILVAVRKQTGASVDIPGAAWGERVFVHLGPGPPRDIISSLVYGLPFDYIVETAEDDPDTLRSIVLTPQGRGDISSDVVVAGATDSGMGSGVGGSIPGADAYQGGGSNGVSRPEGARMMRGWASPGKTTAQAEAEAALAATQAAAQDSAGAQDGAAAQDSTGSQDAVAPKDSAVAQDSAAAADVAESTKEANSSPSTSDPDDPTAAAIQNMTKMFEQRRQIQAQQNHPPAPSSN